MKQIDIVALLQSKPDGMTVNDLMPKFDVNKKILSGRLARLNESEMLIRAKLEGNAYTYFHPSYKTGMKKLRAEAVKQAKEKQLAHQRVYEAKRKARRAAKKAKNTPLIEPISAKNTEPKAKPSQSHEKYTDYILFKSKKLRSENTIRWFKHKAAA